jgi:glutamate/tyrosine decarboxylase-like PLP-dependent enzyme
MAAYLHGSIAGSRDLEEAHDPELGVVCFRHVPKGLSGEALDRHQDRLQAALEADGDGWVSTTRLRGATWLRTAVMNPMTSETDIDRLLADLRRLGAVEASSGDG